MSITLEELTLAIQERYVQKMLLTTKQFLQLKAIPARQLRSYVGGMTWMMSVIAWLRAWVAPSGRP